MRLSLVTGRRRCSFLDRLPNFPHSPACLGRAFEHFPAVILAERALALVSLFMRLQLVNLRHCNYKRNFVELEPLPQFHIFRHPAAPGIDQEHGQLERSPVEQVLLDERLPLPRDVRGDFRESISRQVYEAVATVDLVEIDSLCPAWSATDVSRVTSVPARPDEGVQQAGLSNVASSQKCNLGIAFRRKLLRLGCTYYKPGGHEMGEGAGNLDVWIKM